MTGIESQVTEVADNLVDQLPDSMQTDAEGMISKLIAGAKDMFKSLKDIPFIGPMLANILGESKANRSELAQSITPYSNEYVSANSSKFDHLSVKPGINGLLNMIGEIEGANQYNALVGNADQHVVDLTSMSIGEVIAYQDTMKGSHESTAVGKYQFIQATLSETVSKHNISLDEKFDPEMQDRLAVHLMERRGLNSFIAGKMDMDTFQENLSMEWAALPKDDSNQSYYKGVGSNKALISSSKFREQLSQIA